MLGELAVMDGENDAHLNPAPRVEFPGPHFASARSTSRSSCTMSSASIIWRSKSGS